MKKNLRWKSSTKLINICVEICLKINEYSFIGAKGKQAPKVEVSNLTKSKRNVAINLEELKDIYIYIYIYIYIDETHYSLHISLSLWYIVQFACTSIWYICLVPMSGIKVGNSI